MYGPLYGRMPLASRAEVVAALDCERCRALVAGHAPDPVAIAGPRTADLGTGVAYAIGRHYGKSNDAKDREVCPDCGRGTVLEQIHNDFASLMPLDRDVVGR